MILDLVSFRSPFRHDYYYYFLKVNIRSDVPKKMEIGEQTRIK